MQIWLHLHFSMAFYFFFRCSSNFSQDLQNRLYSIWLLLTSFGSSLAILATNPRLGAFTHVAPSVWHYLDYTESFLFCLAQPFMLGLRFKNYILIHRIAFYKIDVGRYLWEQSFIWLYFLLCHALSQTTGKECWTIQTWTLPLRSLHSSWEDRKKRKGNWQMK